MTEPLPTRRGAPRARNLEGAITWLSVAGALPAVAVAGYFIWTEPLAPEVRWTLAILVAGAWLVATSAARQLAVRSLNLANAVSIALFEALRQSSALDTTFIG